MVELYHNIKIKNMKKILVLASLGIIIFVIGAYIVTPNQKRFKDEDFTEDVKTTPVEIGITKEEKEEVFDGPIYVFYYKSDDTSCTTLVKHQAVGVDQRKLHLEITALNELLYKPVPEGFKTALIPGTIMNKYNIRDGIANVDMSRFLTLSTGPCGTEARKAQIKETLMQFGNIKEIKFLIEGVAE